MIRTRPSRVTWHIAHGVKTYKGELVDYIRTTPGYKRVVAKLRAQREARYRQTERTLEYAFAHPETW